MGPILGGNQSLCKYIGKFERFPNGTDFVFFVLAKGNAILVPWTPSFEIKTAKEEKMTKRQFFEGSWFCGCNVFSLGDENNDY